MRPDAVFTRESLGRALTELRLAADLSVRDVAAEADALQGTVAGWFAGQHAPTRASREMFERVLRVCGVPESEVPGWWAAVERTGRRRGRRRAQVSAPYRGFDAFQPEDSRWFFGREPLVRRLVALVETHAARRIADLASPNADPRPVADEDRPGLAHTVLVVGASGAGKSSLVRAGLVAQTEPGGAFDGWAAVVITPGDDPASALDAAAAALTEVSADRPGLLVIDQVEELWTQSDIDMRRCFSRGLDDLLAGRPIVPVGVLRADFYDRLAAVPALVSSLSQAQIVVPPMTWQELREVIVRPAEVAGVSVDDDLVEFMLDDVVPNGSRASAGVLPLLSYALRATWEQSDGRTLTIGDYVTTGRIGGAVEVAAEDVYSSLDDDERAVAQRVLLSMVNVDEDTVTRRTARLSDLGVTGLGVGGVDDGPVEQVLDAFADARLVTLSAAQAQVSHEALLTAWPRLRSWIDADRERLLLERRLRHLRDTWEANDRPDDLLPGRARLEMFAPISDDGLDLSSREFLAAGRARVDEHEETERRRSRTLRRFAVSAAVLAVVAVLAAVAAIVAGTRAVDEREQADRARVETLSRQLAAQADQLRERDPLLSVQLAMVAYRQAPTVEARSTLIEIASGSVPIRFAGDGGSLKLDRAGSLMVAGGATGQVRLFETGAHGIVRRLGEFRAVRGETEQTIAGVALAPDAATLYLGGRDRIGVWNIADRTHPTLVAEIAGADGDVNDLDVSPDGRMLAASTTRGGVQVWSVDGRGGRPVPLPAKTHERDGAVAFSPDGRTLASSSTRDRIDLWRVDGDRVDIAGEIPISGVTNQLAQDLSFLPDGRLSAALRSRTVKLYDVSTPSAPREVADFGGFYGWARSVASDATGSRLIATDSDNTVRVIDVAAPNAVPRVLATAANSSSVLFVGDHVVVASEDGRVVDWPPADDRVRLGPRTVFQIPADRDGRRVFAANPAADGRITQWRVTGRGLVPAGPDLAPPPGVVFAGSVVTDPSGSMLTLGTLTGAVYFADVSDARAPRLIGSVAAQPNLNETVDYSTVSRLAVTGGTDARTLTVVDAADPVRARVVGTFDVGSGVWWASLHPDGRSVAVATTSGRIVHLDLTDPAHPTPFPDPLRFNGSALSVRFDADGERLVATSEDRVVAVAEVADRHAPREVARLTGPAGQLYSAAFSPDGSHVVAGGSNSEVWLWDLDGERSDQSLVLRSFGGNVYDVRFVGRDRLLASGSNGLIASWRLGADQVIQTQCGRPGTMITPAEWHTYVPGIPYDPPCRR